MPSRRTFVPRLETLEDRCVPAPMVFNGGSAEQIGSSLVINVTSPSNTVFILEDGNGDVWAQWNGWLPNGYSGVSNIQLNGMAASNTVFFANLGAPGAAGQLNLNLMGAINNLIAHVPAGSAFPTIQSGSPVSIATF